MKTNQSKLNQLRNAREYQEGRIQVGIFDQQDGKIVYGTVTAFTEFLFELNCTDGQTRKFDISLIPKNIPETLSLWSNVVRCA